MMLDWLTLLIYALACYRLALLFSSDLGPFRAFERLRSFLKREAKTNTALRKSAVHLGVTCIKCESLWFTAPIATYALFREQMIDEVVMGVDVFLLMLALSAASVIFHRAFPPR